MASNETNPPRAEHAAAARRHLPIWLFLFGPSLLLLAALAIWLVVRPAPSDVRPQPPGAPAAVHAP